MKRILVAITLASILGTSSLASAGDWGYGGYPPPQPQQNRPVLRAIVIGGALIGVGFAIGRLSAPKQYGQQYGPQYGQPPVGYNGYGYGPAPAQGPFARRF